MFKTTALKKFRQRFLAKILWRRWRTRCILKFKCSNCKIIRQKPRNNFFTAKTVKGQSAFPPRLTAFLQRQHLHIVFTRPKNALIKRYRSLLQLSKPLFKITLQKYQKLIGFVYSRLDKQRINLLCQFCNRRIFCFLIGNLFLLLFFSYRCFFSLLLSLIVLQGEKKK